MRRWFVASLLAVSCSSSPDRNEEVEQARAFAVEMHPLAVSRYVALAGATTQAAELRNGLHDLGSYIARAERNASSPLIRFDDARAAECLADVAAATTLADLQDARSSPARSCRRVYAGTVQRGGACGTNGDCAPGDYCAHDGYTCPGTCVARGGAGTPCSPREAYAECAYGTTCTRFAGAQTWQCTPNLLGPGEACGQQTIDGPSVGFCRTGLFCQGAVGASVCVEALALDVPCTSSFQCQPGLTCQSSACRPARRAGETCVVGEMACQVGAVCGASGSCLLQPVDGGACGARGGEFENCLVGTCLESGTCSSVVPFGQPCAAGDLCMFQGMCDPGRLSCGDICG